MTVPWSFRLLLAQTAAFLAVLGWAWVQGFPRHRSIFGLRFRATMQSAEIWREVHRRTGVWMMVLAAWLAVPIPSLTKTFLFQILPVSIFSFIGVVWIRWWTVRQQTRRRS